MTVVLQPSVTAPARKTLLEIVQQTRARLGQPIPSYVAGNPDAGIVQCMALLNEFLEDLVVRKYWSANTIEVTFTSIAAESQGAPDAICQYGFEGIVPDTFYDRTSQLPIQGGLTAEQWAARKASNATGPLYAFRLRRNSLLINPVPPAGHTFALEYFSNYFVYNPVSFTYRKYWFQDTDTCTVDDALPMAYLKWAWRREKGLDYAEDFRKYESLIASKALRDERKPTINMEGSSGDYSPGVFVSPGSWSL